MRIYQFTLAVLVALSLVYPEISGSAEKAKDDRVVKDGMSVSFDYTLKDADGKVIETSKGNKPLTYIHGQKSMIPGLEKQLAGMKVGDEKNVRVKPEDAYGPMNAKAFEEVPKEKLPPEGLKVGATLAAKTPDGRVIPMRVHEIKEKTVVMDMNHPMAGKTLVFDVKIVDIQDPPPPPTPPAKSAAPVQPAKPAQPAKPVEPVKPAEPAKK